ncbi:MAG: amylo-alpha-1,6-glucosidase [Candidatus Micrarchaeota archaeon]|nr:amylo-alpha-1,6-glucosidase [Candidatus Micrarchaeota archaeon]
MAEKTFQYLAEKEWWLTNGAGGWASSTIANANTTKYHGVFICSEKGKRYLLVSTLEEFAIFSSKKYPLSTQIYKEAIYPRGYENISDFLFNPSVARWTYNVENNKISKEIWTGEQTNQTYVRYTLLEGDGIGLSIIPIFACREIHQIGGIKIPQEKILYAPRIIKFHYPFEWQIITNRGLITKYSWDYYNFFYKKEFEREEQASENLYSLFQINAYIKEGQNLEICFCKELTPYIEAQLKEHSIKSEIEKAYNKIDPHFYGLLARAHSFLIKNKNKFGVCAGYPYFWQWARDTFISLPGLCLPLKKYRIFLEILKKWLEYSVDGILPNRIEQDEEPVYESVDGFLWLIWAVREFEKQKKLPKKIKSKILEQFYYWLEPNNYFEIDDDGLVKLKEPRLTWMDTIIDGKPTNPRIGKPIEINSLWLYALKYALEEDKKNSKEYKIVYNKAKEGMKKFLLQEHLADIIEPIDEANRPNQLWAFALVPEIFAKNKEYLEKIREKLFVKGCGFYSLEPNDKNFVKIYQGDIVKRDRAYHNGAIWPYFIGAYTDAWLNFNLELKTIEEDVLSLMKNNNSKALFSIPEIYRQQDFEADGCQLQAWSVAETIRAYTNILKTKKEKIEKTAKKLETIKNKF